MLLPPPSASLDSTSPASPASLKPFPISLTPTCYKEPPQLLKSTSGRAPTRRVPLQNQFPSLLYGDGVRGHRFHVLKEAEDGSKWGPWYWLEEEEIQRLNEEEIAAAIAAVPDCPQQ